MNWYKTLKKSTIVLSIFYIGILCAQATTSECEACPVCAESTNIWYKISTDDLTYGNKIRLDMSKGKSFSDGMYNLSYGARFRYQRDSLYSISKWRRLGLLFLNKIPST